MKVFEDYDISKLNTLGVKAKSRYFTIITLEQDIKGLFSSKIFQDNEKLFIGSGSNILFVEDFSGIIIANRLKGIEIIKEDSKEVWIKCFGGELWNDLVNFTINKGYWGIENLALIPGTVGAAPIQNIGAYGVEVKDVIDSVETYEVLTGNKKNFKNSECSFGYRDSVFKNEMKGRYFISAIVIKLKKKENKNIKYKVIEDYIINNNLIINTPKDVAEIITKIRMTKLPDPKILGNAGSFFKNVYVNEGKLNELKQKYEDLPYFNEENHIKIPTAWLIEKCGWKGKRVGNVGVHENQALVIVNYGDSSGREIKNFSEEIIRSVFEKFGINIEREVNLI